MGGRARRGRDTVAELAGARASVEQQQQQRACLHHCTAAPPRACRGLARLVSPLLQQFRAPRRGSSARERVERVNQLGLRSSRGTADAGRSLHLSASGCSAQAQLESIATHPQTLISSAKGHTSGHRAKAAGAAVPMRIGFKRLRIQSAPQAVFAQLHAAPNHNQRRYCP